MYQLCQAQCAVGSFAIPFTQRDEFRGCSRANITGHLLRLFGELQNSCEISGGEWTYPVTTSECSNNQNFLLEGFSSQSWLTAIPRKSFWRGTANLQAFVKADWDLLEYLLYSAQKIMRLSRECLQACCLQAATSRQRDGVGFSGFECVERGLQV